MSEKKHRMFTTEFKRTTAEAAIQLKENDIKTAQLETITGINKDHLNKWIRAYKNGEYDDKPDPPTKQPESKRLGKEIDTRPELKKIAESIDNFSNGIEALCVRLDTIIKKFSDIPPSVFKEMEA